MRFKTKSKKGLIVLITIFVIAIMITPFLTQVLGAGKTETAGSTKATIGYVDDLDDLVKYNNDGVQVVEVTDITQKAEILNRVQSDPDFKQLLQEVANTDAEDSSIIDIEIVSLQLSSVNPLVVIATHDNGNLDRKTTGGSRYTIAIEIVSLSLTSINGNGIHITVAMDADKKGKIVAGVVTNNIGKIDTDGLEHQVYFVKSILIINHKPVYWHLWWYDSHSHQNWYYGWYYWYWKYNYYYHYDWYPWYTWYWGGWYYWHYWNYWSTSWPYYVIY